MGSGSSKTDSSTTFGALRDQVQQQQQQNNNNSNNFDNKSTKKKKLHKSKRDSSDDDDAKLSVLQRARKNRYYHHQHRNNNNNDNIIHSFARTVRPEDFVAPSSTKNNKINSNENDDQQQEQNDDDQSKRFSKPTPTLVEEIYLLNPLIFPTKTKNPMWNQRTQMKTTNEQREEISSFFSYNLPQPNTASLRRRNDHSKSGATTTHSNSRRSSAASSNAAISCDSTSSNSHKSENSRSGKRRGGGAAAAVDLDFINRQYNQEMCQDDDSATATSLQRRESNRETNVDTAIEGKEAQPKKIKERKREGQRHSTQHPPPPPPAPLPLTTNVIEAPRYGVDEDFFNVLTHFSSTTEQHEQRQENREQRQHNAKPQNNLSETSSSCPFRLFGEGLGTNHLLEPAARRCGVRRQKNKNNKYYYLQDLDKMAIMQNSGSFFSPPRNDRGEIIIIPSDSSRDESKKDFYASSVLQKFGISSFDENENSNNSSAIDSDSEVDDDDETKASSMSSSNTTAYYSVSSSSNCRRCSFCNQCTFHSPICLSAKTNRCPHSAWLLKRNNNVKNTELFERASSSHAFCRLEPSPLLLEKIMDKNFSSLSSPSVSVGISLSELHSNLLGLVLELGVNHPVFSYHSNNNNNNTCSDYEDGLDAQLQKAHVIVAQLLEACGLTAILFSFLSSLHWSLGSPSGLLHLLACDVIFDFSSSTITDISNNNKRKSFINIDWWPKIRSSNNKHHGDNNDHVNEDCGMNLFTVIDLLLFSSSPKNRTNFPFFLAQYWSSVSRRYDTTSTGSCIQFEVENTSRNNVEDISSRLWFLKMRSSVASSIVSSVLQNLLIVKNGGVKCLEN